VVVERLDWSAGKIPPLIKGEFLQPQGVHLLQEQESFSYLTNWVQISKISHEYNHPLYSRPLRFDIEFDKPFYGLGILHEDIVQGLRRHYLELGGELIEGATIADHEKIRKGHLTTLEWKRDLYTIKSDVFVGADGRFSLSRKNSKLKLLDIPCDRVMIAGLAKNIQLPVGEFYTCEVPLGVVYAFSYGNLTRVYYCFAKSRLDEALKDKEAFLREVILKSMLKVGSRIEFSGPVLIMPTADSMMPQRSLGNSIWIGDAAGSLDPLGGYGMSVALKDAHRVAAAIIANPKNPAEEFQYVSSLCFADYLSARFFSMWIGRLFMGGNRLSQLAKWNALQKIKNSEDLRRDVIDRFGGLKTEPFAFTDVPYYLGLLPTNLRDRFEALKIIKDLRDIQNSLLTTPTSLKKDQLVGRIRSFAPRFINI
jgi:2-polyprenyl-6-methoxyphenol hydroxylase-like FAD-dependent oxidoreductase